MFNKQLFARIVLSLIAIAILFILGATGALKVICGLLLFLVCIGGAAVVIIAVLAWIVVAFWYLLYWAFPNRIEKP